MHLEPSPALESVRVIRENVDPTEIAQEYIIHELIKMFPDADSDFYDKIRYHVRQFKDHHGEDRFWRLVAGLSEAYMFKPYFRMLQGNEYKWIYAEVPLEKIYTPMLIQDGTPIGDLMKKHKAHVIKVGEELREIPWEDRSKIIHPYDFKRDNYPIVMHEEDGNLVVLDGSRRMVNNAIYNMAFVEAYLAIKTGNGKPSLREDFVADLFKFLRETEPLDKDAVSSFIAVATHYKKYYINGPKLIDDYIRGAVFNMLESRKDIKDKEAIQKMFEDVLALDPNA